MSYVSTVVHLSLQCVSYDINIVYLPSEDLLVILPEVAPMDSAFEEKGKVLVHCTAGRSQSAAVLQHLHS